MKWQVKLVKNALVGMLPLSVQQMVRTAKRSLIPHELVLDLVTLQQGLMQVRMLQHVGTDLHGKDMLEVGTGWSPVIPLIFHFAGCRSVTLVDIQRLMDDHTFQETCRQMVEHRRLIADSLAVDSDAVGAKLTMLSRMSLASGMQAIGCRYLAPCNVLHAALPAKAFDVLTSRAVLEHIPRPVLEQIFAEAHRLLRDQGLMCHIVDNSDHWEHEDKTITRVNFLTLSEKTFDLLSSLNPLDYQNRLRHSEYLRMMQAAGFAVVHDTSVPDPQALRDVARIKLDAGFTAFTPQDLAILTTNVVARKVETATKDRESPARQIQPPSTRRAPRE